ncbi:PorP/SprF family type IX secretion system membrane protein [Ichthyenterobacterium sp. W332]|uniref:PorP/SprF family type IX secretion system membrane protein n=1 Tax=Microcosmobacter mediterraneus TaxID=3075607 RepID=A0ABU2YLX9_9FLAO|nr:PorP/SprF family type IX secretion system membrane protein [Ichthyenterobacterium sp. W332]MDT0558842.1 PorP/SprF family type IX secretion system membrane protein [Ichthyenterobacterium sp. W332]
MKTILLILLLSICSIQFIYSQEEDAVVSLNLPVRNSLTFNRYVINPTFSFVREQTKFISVYNKREWVQFNDAPNTYLASFSGRFAENIGAGVGFFQQNYGVLTTFGGVLNFAYNARLATDNNLTFGVNIGAYKSGINTSNVITNFDDPSFQNVPENFLLTLNPGINFGTEFFDFGVSVNNLVVYNIQNSTMIEDNPQQGIQGHIMYTGYMDSAGFFDESKFSGLLRSEFRKDETIISALAMVTVPKGIWAQVGYNNVFGISGGLGLNITEQFAIEYNFEKGLGDLTNFGPSHDITLAYRFKTNKRYDYSSEDEVAGLLSGNNRKPKLSKEQIEANKKLAEVRKAQIEENRLLAAQQKAERDAKLKAKKEAEASIAKEQKANAEKTEAKEEAEAQAKLLAEQKAKEEAEAQAKQLAEQKAKEEAEAQAKLLAEQEAKEEAEAQAKLLAEQKAKEEAEAQAKLLAEQKAKEEAEAQAKLLAEQEAKEEAEAQAKLLAEQKAKEEAEAQAKLLAEQEAKKELISNPKDEDGKALLALAKDAENSKQAQNNLLKEFNDIVKIKNQDLKDLKEENDLSEQGIAVEPKPFKSITAENNKLNAIKADLDIVIKDRNTKLEELMALYDRLFEADTITNSEVYLFYKKKIKEINAEQAKALLTRTNLDKRLEEIRVATEFEKRRRIKRAAFDNEEERYAQDRAALQNIKQTTSIDGNPLKTSDLDFGETQSNNISILKNINNIDNGYYLVLAVHTDKSKRDEFVKQVYASGVTNIDFFYDVNTSKYYIYYVKFNDINSANDALKSKGNNPYNTNMSLIKIEN